MGGPGSGRWRQKKTLEQQLAEGDPGKVGMNKLRRMKAVEDRDFQPEACYGPCPSHIQGRAKVMWDLWTKALEHMHLDKKPDVALVEAACMAYERATRADITLRRDGAVIYQYEMVEDEKTGKMRKVLVKAKKHPACDVSTSAWMVVRNFSAEFGLTPMARTRLAMRAKDGPAAEEKTQDNARTLEEILMMPRKSVVERTLWAGPPPGKSSEEPDGGSDEVN